VPRQGTGDGANQTLAPAGASLCSHTARAQQDGNEDGSQGPEWMVHRFSATGVLLLAHMPW
jgi:hypothetical protein